MLILNSLHLNRLIFIKLLFWGFAKILFTSWLACLIINFYVYPSPFENIPFCSTPDQEDSEQINIIKEKNIREIQYYKISRDVSTIEEKYKNLAGVHYSQTIEPHLSTIDKVLIEKGLDKDALFIQAMFYIGQHESHWRPSAVSSFIIEGGHPTGIFQFLPGTFRSVSAGNIFNAEDQIRAFVTMIERGRADEFQTIFICSFAPCLSREAKSYILNYSEPKTN